VNWYEQRKVGPVLLKVCAKNKEKKKVNAYVSFQSETGNIRCPNSFFRESFLDADTKCLGHLLIIDPT